MDKIDKLLWIWMIETGTIGEWSYYGGGYGLRQEGSWANHEKRLADIPKTIKRVKVDWKKTKPLTDGYYDAFNGTFNEADSVTTMEGTLVLRDGTKIPFGISAREITDDIRDIIKIALDYADKLDKY